MSTHPAAPWLESAGVILLAVAGGAVGRWCARRGKTAMAIGFGTALLLGLVLVAGSSWPPLWDWGWFGWVTDGFRLAVLMAPVIALLLSVPLAALPHSRQQVLVGLFLVLALAYYSVLPFLLPAFNRAELLKLTNQIDSDGVCLQSTAYTCGPAAAVTALNRCGLEGSESELALLARCNAWSGTTTPMLGAVLRQRYEADGLRCQVRLFRRAAELEPQLPFIAQMKFSLLLDHFVTVLAISNNQVQVADPLSGLKRMSVEQFEAQTRGLGLALQQIAATTPTPSTHLSGNHDDRLP